MTMMENKLVTAIVLTIAVSAPGCGDENLPKPEVEPQGLLVQSDPALERASKAISEALHSAQIVYTDARGMACGEMTVAAVIGDSAKFALALSALQNSLQTDGINCSEELRKALVGAERALDEAKDRRTTSVPSAAKNNFFDPHEYSHQFEVLAITPERREVIQAAVAQELALKPSLASYITHRPDCVTASQAWSATEGICALEGRRTNAHSDRIATKGDHGFYRLHVFISFPDQAIFDSTYRQYLNVSDIDRGPDTLPDYFIGSLSDLIELFKKHKELLYPPIKKNILEIEAASNITDEHIERFVWDVWGEALYKAGE